MSYTTRLLRPPPLPQSGQSYPHQKWKRWSYDRNKDITSGGKTKDIVSFEIWNRDKDLRPTGEPDASISSRCSTLDQAAWAMLTKTNCVAKRASLLGPWRLDLLSLKVTQKLDFVRFLFLLLFSKFRQDFFHFMSCFFISEKALKTGSEVNKRASLFFLRLWQKKLFI